MVAGGGGITGGGEKEGESMADGGEEKKSGKDGFLPTLYTDFFMLRPWNWNLFIGDVRE